MPWNLIIIGIVLSIPAYFLWVTIHEVSHLVAVKATTGTLSWTLRVIPYIEDGTIWWGRIKWDWARTPTTNELALVRLAPRIPDLIAAVVFPTTALFSEYGFVIWGVLWGAGLVDLAVGSVGYSETSDLRRGAVALDSDPWILRLPGFAIVALSVALMVILKTSMGR